MMRVCLIILAVVRIALTVLAVEVTWDFPRLGNCHEGMAFADGVTGVLVWGGGDELRLTVGRADMWDHRGGVCVDGRAELHEHRRALEEWGEG